MPIYLTQSGNYASVDIEAASWTDAEYILEEMKQKFEVPHDTIIIGEEVECLEFPYNKPNLRISDDS